MKPYLVDLEIENMKTIILEYKHYSQKCPRQPLRFMQLIVLEEHLDTMYSETGDEMEEFMLLERDEFIAAMLHAANSSRKWKLMIKNSKMEKSDVSLSTYVQYVEDFCLWMNRTGRVHCLSEKEATKCFFCGLKSDVFCEEMYFVAHSRPWRM